MPRPRSSSPPSPRWNCLRGWEPDILERLDQDLFVVRSPQRFFGLEMGTRMTVLRFGDELLLISPVARSPELGLALGELGEVRWVLAPNLFHHLHAGDWLGANTSLLAAPGLAEKRPDLDIHSSLDGDVELPAGLKKHFLQCFPLASETVFLHEPTRTLVVTDILFNYGPDAPALTKMAMTLALGYPGVKSTTLERFFMKRDLARTELENVLSWDFSRILLAHGNVVAEDGPRLMRQAYSWLLG